MFPQCFRKPLHCLCLYVRCGVLYGDSYYGQILTPEYVRTEEHENRQHRHDPMHFSRTSHGTSPLQYRTIIRSYYITARSDTQFMVSALCPPDASKSQWNRIRFSASILT